MKLDSHTSNTLENGYQTPSGDWLTENQFVVAKMVALGKMNKEIAGDLNVSERAVEKQRQEAYDKLNIHSAAQLTHFMLHNGLITNLYDT